jgi:hypothetical protein
VPLEMDCPVPRLPDDGVVDAVLDPGPLMFCGVFQLMSAPIADVEHPTTATAPAMPPQRPLRRR